MKNFATLAAVLLLAVVGVHCQSNDYPEEIQKVVDTCLKKFDISKEEYTTAEKNNDFNSNSKFRCFSDCFMTESGSSENGEIKLEKVKDIVRSFNPDVNIAEVDNQHAKCMEQAQQKTDKCDYAREYSECMKSVFMKPQ